MSEQGDKLNRKENFNKRDTKFHAHEHSAPQQVLLFQQEEKTKHKKSPNDISFAQGTLLQFNILIA